MIRQSTKTKVFEKLVASLESAEGESRELDIIISFVLGDTSSDGGKMIQLLVEEGYPWDIISELLDEGLPPYTRSLDAAVPGENVVLTLYSAKRSRWAAVHKTPEGKHVLVWAATECLARRTAALKALHSAARPLGHGVFTGAPGRAAGTVETPPREEPRPREWRGTAGPAGPEEAEEEGEEEGEEWKILF